MAVKREMVIALTFLVVAYVAFSSRTDHISVFAAAEDGGDEMLVRQIVSKRPRITP
jgi:hypothetical protein